MTSSTVAVCQEWVMTWSGSEQVASRLAAATGARDVFTYAALPELLRKVFPGRTVRTSRLGRTSFARRHWSWLLPLMARWWRRLDLDAYDVVLTCSHSTVNSVRVRDGAAHVSYCCTPMRYAWTWRSEIGRVPPPFRALWPLVAAVLRRQDRRRAGNVDLFLAVSRNVAGRVRRFYDKPSIVVYPPVDTERFSPDPSVPREEFFLYAGRLVAYKRPDVVVRAAERAGVKVVVAGSGPELERLREIAGPTVSFREQPSDAELLDLYRRARALVFAGSEDLGMVLVEAQACGTPVIALADGGALEAVRDGETGVLYGEPTVDALADAMRSFDPGRYDPAVCRAHAERFGVGRFDTTVAAIVDRIAAAAPGSRGTAVAQLLAEHGADQ